MTSNTNRSFGKVPCASVCFLILLSCHQKKVDLPSEAPQVSAVSANPQGETAAVTTAQINTANAATAQVPSASAASAATKVTASTVTQPDTITRVSGQVNSGKQGQASFKIGGHIAKTVVQVGEKIRKGQVLAMLDDTDAQLRLKLAQNQLEQAGITLEQAKKDLQREEQLKKEGATTQTNLERISNALAAARIGHAQAQINLQQAEKTLADTKLTAAFDGVVSRRLKVEGEYVGVGAPVFEVASMSELEVSLRVPESLIKKVKPGHQVNLSIPSLGKDAQARILRIVPVIQENSRTFEVIGRVQGALPGEIIPGQFVEAQL